MKIPDDVHDELRRLSALVAKHGWLAFGIDRDDPPTQTAVISEAIRQLAARLTAKRSTKR